MNEGTMHIQAAKREYGNSAAALALAKLETDWYHANIHLAAQAMVEAGLGDWTYVTQYGTGNSTWSGGKLEEYVLVQQDRDGNFQVDIEFMR